MFVGVGGGRGVDQRPSCHIDVSWPASTWPSRTVVVEAPAAINAACTSCASQTKRRSIGKNRSVPDGIGRLAMAARLNGSNWICVSRTHADEG